MVRTVKSALLLACAAVLSTGCHAALNVRAMQPAKYNFGAAKELHIVQSEGRRSAREELISHLIKTARSTNHWTVTDRTEEGIQLRAAGRTANITGAREPQSRDQVWARIDVLEWATEKDTRTQPAKTDAKGEVVEPAREVKILRGKALIAVTAATASGRAILAEKEFQGVWQVDLDRASEDEVRINAAREAIQKLLAEITPTPVVRAVRLDEDDKGQQHILKLAKDGNLGAAIAEMKAYLQQNPTSAAAHYNFGVFLDASGSYQEAVEAYNKALQNSTKDYYAEAKAGAQKRLDDELALGQ